MSAGIDWTFGHGFPPTPQPHPVPNGDPVVPSLVAFLSTESGSEKVITLLREREEFGRAKYGQPLMTKDGRDTLEDARQEFGDLLQYIYKGRMNGEDMSSIKDMLWALDKVLE